MNQRRPSHGLIVFFGIITLCFVFGIFLLERDSDDLPEKGPRIGVILVQGMISDARPFIKAARTFRKDKKIKGILVRIDSPGGAVGPSQEIFREIVKTRRVKPVVASMQTVAASGGYYVAAACEKIIADAGTLTGSIGVITQTTEIRQLLELTRVRVHTMKSGRYKDTGSPMREMTDEDRQMLQSLVDAIHQQFVKDVAKGRKLSPGDLEPIADGRILTGEQALSHKLVDRLGNFTDALDEAAKLAKVKGEPVPIYYREQRGLLRELLDDGVQSAAKMIGRKLLGTSARVEAVDPLLR